MNGIVLLICIGLLAVVLYLPTLIKKRAEGDGDQDASDGRSGKITYPYVKKGPLLTPAERSFLGVLEKIVDNRCRIYAQVRLADIVSIRAGTDKRQRQFALNRITSKHVDFVVCDRNTLDIWCAIELDDSTHAREDRKTRDKFVDEVFQAAKLPLVRIVTRAAYQPDEVRNALKSAIGPMLTETSVNDSPAPVEGAANVIGSKLVLRRKTSPAGADQLGSIDGVVVEPIGEAAQDPVAHDAELSVEPSGSAGAGEAPSCPKCSGLTVLRTVKSGARANSKLWGCIKYPACRGMIPVHEQTTD